MPEELPTATEIMHRMNHLESEQKWHWLALGISSFVSVVPAGDQKIRLLIDLLSSGDYCVAMGSRLQQLACQADLFVTQVSKMGKLWELGISVAGIVGLTVAMTSLISSKVEFALLDQQLANHKFRD